MSFRYTAQSDWDKNKASYQSLTFHFWLVLYPDGDLKMSRGEPSVERTGRKMKMQLVVPTAVFKTPELKATVTIADPGQHDMEIDVEAASAALKATLGMDVQVVVVEPGE